MTVKILKPEHKWPWEVCMEDVSRAGQTPAVHALAYPLV